MFDSHAHMAFYQYDDDRDAVVKRAQEAGVAGWMEIGTDLEQSQKAVALADQYDNVWATVGVHPSDIDSLNEDVWRALEELALHPKVKAIGEVGLDLYRGGDLKTQKEVLHRFIDLAQRRDMPMVFHIRSGADADLHEEMITLLTAYEEEKRPRGVMHTFSGTVEQANRYVELGQYISFSGVVTFTNAEETVRVAASVPVERMLIETDCPFLTPDPHRGERNEPAYVALVAARLAEVRGVPVQEIMWQTQANAQALFGLV